jgi:hypothetical protein
MTTVTNREAVAAIYNGEPFRNSGKSFRADYAHYAWQVSTGRMPADACQMLTQAVARAAELGAPLYVVYSYATPIAWALEGELLTVPDVRYSVTTSRHQSLCLGGVVGGAYVTTGERVALAA